MLGLHVLLEASSSPSPSPHSSCTLPLAISLNLCDAFAIAVISIPSFCPVSCRSRPAAQLLFCLRSRPSSYVHTANPLGPDVRSSAFSSFMLPPSHPQRNRSPSSGSSRSCSGSTPPTHPVLSTSIRYPTPARASRVEAASKWLLWRQSAAGS